MLINCSIVRDALFLPVQVMSRGPLPWLMDTHRAIFPSSKAQAFMVMPFIAVAWPASTGIASVLSPFAL